MAVKAPAYAGDNIRNRETVGLVGHIAIAVKFWILANSLLNRRHLMY